MSAVDPYREAIEHGPAAFLYRLNPLAKAFGPIPVMVVMFFVRDSWTPLAVLAFALAVVLVGSRPGWRVVVALVVGIPLGILVFSVSFGIWSDVSRLPDSAVILQLGAWRFTVAQWLVGLSTATRLAAVLVLTLISGLTTTGVDLTRSMVQQLRVPYRVGYAALAAFRFVPRFATELELIRAAHRVRGMDAGRGPIAAVRRWTGRVVPLLAGGIRHAERVALAMDGRGFGYAATRTERHLTPWRARDWVFTIGFWVVCSGIVAAMVMAGVARFGTG
jgi:energy-coupling factor transport system permease protein